MCALYNSISFYVVCFYSCTGVLTENKTESQQKLLQFLITLENNRFEIYKCCFFDIWHFPIPPTEFHQMSNILIVHVLRLAVYF